MDFVIYFVGLVAHLTFTPVGEPERQVAVALAASHHKVELIVHPNDVIPTPLRDLFTYTGSDILGRDYYDLSGQEIYIVGLPAGGTTAKLAGMRDVLSLKTITGTTDLKVTVKKHDKGHGTYVNLQGGKLDVDGYYSKMGQHTTMNQMKCIPSRVKYTANTGSGTVVEIVSDKGKYMRLKGNAKVFIANLPSTVSSGHYGEYKNLMQGAASAGAWVERGNCTDTGKLIFDPSTLGKAASIECTNSQFP